MILRMSAVDMSLTSSSAIAEEPRSSGMQLSRDVCMRPHDVMTRRGSKPVKGYLA